MDNRNSFDLFLDENSKYWFDSAYIKNMFKKRRYLIELDKKDILSSPGEALTDCYYVDTGIVISYENEGKNRRVYDFFDSGMPYKEKVKIKKGWFPETLADMKNEKYVFVNVETGLYAPTYNAIKYYIPRLVRGGIIMISNYEDANKTGVSAAIRDIEKEWCPFLITPLCDLDGTIMITRP